MSYESIAADMERYISKEIINHLGLSVDKAEYLEIRFLSFLVIDFSYPAESRSAAETLAAYRAPIFRRIAREFGEYESKVDSHFAMRKFEYMYYMPDCIKEGARAADKGVDLIKALLNNINGQAAARANAISQRQGANFAEKIQEIGAKARGLPNKQLADHGTGCLSVVAAMGIIPTTLLTFLIL